MTELLMLEYEEQAERDELASVIGADPADLTSASQSQLDAIASYHLRKMSLLEAELKERAESLKLETELVRFRYEKDMGRIRDSLALREAAVKAVASMADFGTKKSRNVGFGVYGGRVKKGGLRVTDDAALLTWAGISCRAALRVTVKESIDKRALDQYFADSGEEIPGTMVEDDVVEWFAKPEPA